MLRREPFQMHQRLDARAAEMKDSFAKIEQTEGRNDANAPHTVKIVSTTRMFQASELLG